MLSSYLDLIGEHAHDITASQQSQCSIAQLVEVYFKRNHASSGTACKLTAYKLYHSCILLCPQLCTNSCLIREKA